MNENPNIHRKGSLIWPIILISFGIVLLLNNLEILDWDVWKTIIRLWPFLLIIIGLDILLGRKSGAWSIIPLFLVFGLFAAGTWLIQETHQIWSYETYTHTISQRINGSNQADVAIDFSVGELEVGKTTESEILIEAELDLIEGESLNQEYTTQDGVGFIELGSTVSDNHPSWFFNDWLDGKREWAINLTGDIPIDLNIDTGVGKVTVDFVGIQLENLDVDSGIGETEVYLPSSGSFNAWISLGIGRLVIYIPQDLIVRIHLDTGLGNKSISGDYLQNGDFYTSPEYNDIGKWVELNLDVGIGEVRIIQVR